MITKKQLTNISVSLMIVRMFFSEPKELVSAAGNSAWILVIYNTLVALLIFWGVSVVYRKNESILEIAENVGGGGFRIFTGFISVIFIMARLVPSVKLFSESVQTVLLQKTPGEIISVFLTIALIFGARSGLEALSIVSGLFLPVVMGVLAIFILFLIPHFNMTNLAPILGTGVRPIFLGGLDMISVFADIFLLNFFLPYCKDDGALKESGVTGTVFSGVVLFFLVFFYGGIFPYPVSTEYIIPIFQLMRIIEIGDFFGRAEALFEFVWAISFLIYASVNIYALCIVWQKTFGLKFYKPLVIPMTAIVVAAGFLESSVVEIVNDNKAFSGGEAVFTFLVPFVYGAVSRCTDKK